MMFDSLPVTGTARCEQRVLYHFKEIEKSDSIRVRSVIKKCDLESSVFIEINWRWLIV